MPRYYDDVYLVDLIGRVTGTLNPRHANIALGGAEQDGDLSLRNRAGDLTVHLNGQNGSVTLGGEAQDGDLMLRNAANVQTIHVNGSSAAVHLGAEGQDGDLFLYDRSGRATLHLDGETGNVRVRGRALNVPDYVFAADYHLRSLDSLRDHVGTHGHLPTVPGRAELEAEGVDLVGFSMALLKSVEELTLHVIELDRRLKVLEEGSDER